MKHLLLISVVSLSLMGSASSMQKLKSELDIRRGLIQPLSTESITFLCEQPASKTKPIIMSVFSEQLKTGIGHTLNITVKDAEEIADSYISGSKNLKCPTGSKLISKCGPCSSGSVSENKSINQKIIDSQTKALNTINNN